MARRIGLKSLGHFSKQAAVSMKSGLTLSRAIPIITGDSRDRLLRTTMGEINASISGGETLSDAVRSQADRFPRIFVEMISAGERTGHLAEIFQRLADYFDMRLRIRRVVIRASIYPAILFTIAFAVVCLFLYLSAKTDLLGGSASTLGIIASAMVGTVFGGIVALVFFSQTSIGRNIWDRIVLGLPGFRSLTIKLCMVRFSRTLAMQLESAIPVTEAVERSALVAGNTVVAKSLKAIADPIRQGSNLAEAVRNSRYVTPIIREVITVSEETGSFEDSLYRIANIYEEETMLVLESMPKFIMPMAVILVGLLVIYLYYSFYRSYLDLLTG